MSHADTPHTLNPLVTARRVVLKISSSLLVTAGGRALHQEWLDSMAHDIRDLRTRGVQVMVVSSGAVALGRHVLGLPAGTLRLEDRRAAAACGQVLLAREWHAALERQGCGVAQVLLTPQDTEERRPYLSVRDTLSALFARGIVPIINENDTVALEARGFSDNDQLAARVAAMMAMECLVLLSDIDGFYTADPRRDPSAQFIPEIRTITPEIAAMAGESTSGSGRGGMITKLGAARTALHAGCAMAIASGLGSHPVQNILKGGRATWFIPDRTPIAARKLWIAGTLRPRGSVTLDEGAVHALHRGRSLLAAGMIAVEGDFERGDPVRVLDSAGVEIARGLIAYTAAECRLIRGARSEMFETLLGYIGAQEVIHRDNLVMTCDRGV